MTCPFCTLSPHEILYGYPVAEGHMLVVPKRHVASIFELDLEEYGDLWRLVGNIRGEYDDRAVNVGVNDGVAAGQTVQHAHVHIIPRKAGDAADPRGGVRWVLPEKADSWTARN